jgi:hypothetical protein
MRLGSTQGRHGCNRDGTRHGRREDADPRRATAAGVKEEPRSISHSPSLYFFICIFQGFHQFLDGAGTQGRGRLARKKAFDRAAQPGRHHMLILRAIDSFLVAHLIFPSVCYWFRCILKQEDDVL